MTTLCGGGTSAPKAGYASVVDFSAGLLAQFLITRGLRWFIPALPVVALPTQELATFCATDPPAVPTFTTAETTAMLTLSFGSDFDSGISKLRDLLLHIAWYEVCECTSGSLTAFPTITPPTDTPIFQPPVSPSVAACWTDAITQYSRSSGGPSFAGFITHGGAFGLNITSAVVTMEVGASTGNFNVTVEIRQQTIDAATTGHTYSFNRGVGTASVNVTWDPLYPLWAVYLTGQAGTGNRDVDVSAKFYCDGQVPGGTLTPCCPPDDATQAYLDYILKMVTLIQRQSAPFAYVYGANHTGLSGDGEFAVTGLLGVSVDVTTLPDRAGVLDGTPETLFDVGYVTLGTSDGWVASKRIDHDGTLFLPPSAGVFTRVGYTVGSDVVIDVRELVREP